MSKLIKIGTRGSKLALWQAYHVENLLQKSGLKSEIVIIDTKGDQILNVSISKIGSKGVFTQELEDQLQDGRIDIAVHSAKDMQSNLPAGFEIIAFTESGSTPLMMSRFNSSLPIYAFSRHTKTQAKVELYLGVESIPFSEFEENQHATYQRAIEELRTRGYVKSGDLVILTKGDYDNLQGGTNGLKVLMVE